jgi:hypothetical protein
MPDIDSINFGRTVLEQAIGESAGRCADVETDGPRRIEGEPRQGRFQLLPSASDISLGRLNFHGRVISDSRPRLVHDALANGNFAGHDGALGLFAALVEPACHEQLIETHFHGIADCGFSIAD